MMEIIRAGKDLAEMAAERTRRHICDVKAGRFWVHNGAAINLYNGVYVQEEQDRLDKILEITNGEE